MAKQPPAPTKTDIVRDYLKGNPTASAGQIVSDLKAHGISHALAAKVKSRYGKKKPGRKPRATAPAASSANGTKADAIRDVAKTMPKPVRPRDVIAVLKEQGVTASSAQVSTVLREMGMRRRRRRKATAGSATRALATSSTEISIDDLVAAKKLVGQVGSIEKVKEALSALARLGQAVKQVPNTIKESRMRIGTLLLAVFLATSCSKTTAPPAASPPVTAGPFVAKLTDYYGKLGGDLPGRAFPIEMLAAGGGGNSVENNFGTMGGTCKHTDFNSYRCTTDEAGWRMRKLETELRTLAQTCSVAVEPAAATITDDPLAGFKFHYTQGHNQGDVEATISESADQSEAKPDAGEVVYRVEVVVSETGSAAKEALTRAFMILMGSKRLLPD